MTPATCSHPELKDPFSADRDVLREGFLRRVAFRLLREGDSRRGNLFLRAADDRRPLGLGGQANTGGRTDEET